MKPGPAYEPAPGDEVVITVRGRVKRLAANGHAALVELDTGSTRWIEIPKGELPSTGLQWALAEPKRRAAS